MGLKDCIQELESGYLPDRFRFSHLKVLSGLALSVDRAEGQSFDLNYSLSPRYPNTTVLWIGFDARHHCAKTLQKA